jgi:hypothetical protein
MERVLIIRKPTGQEYHVFLNGNMVQANRSFKATGNWKFLGLKHVKRSEFIPLEELTPDFLKTFDSRWKNGNPQWTVVDRDYSTIRVWGNIKYHGVAKLWFEELPKGDM